MLLQYSHKYIYLQFYVEKTAWWTTRVMDLFVSERFLTTVGKTEKNVLSL